MRRAKPSGTSAVDWKSLSEKRLLRKKDVAFAVALDRLLETRPSDYTVVVVSLQFSRTFTEVTRAFAEAFRFPEWFGENADALSDLLNDLPSGRYIVKVTGIKNLDKQTILKLEMVLSDKREGGDGYGDGEAVFVLT